MRWRSHNSEKVKRHIQGVRLNSAAFRALMVREQINTPNDPQPLNFVVSFVLSIDLANGSTCNGPHLEFAQATNYENAPKGRLMMYILYILYFKNAQNNGCSQFWPTNNVSQVLHAQIKLKTPICSFLGKRILLFDQPTNHPIPAFLRFGPTQSVSTNLQTKPPILLSRAESVLKDPLGSDISQETGSWLAMLQIDKSTKEKLNNQLAISHLEKQDKG